MVKNKTIKEIIQNAPLGTNPSEQNQTPKKTSLGKFYEKYKDKIDGIKIFLLTILGYGVLINYLCLILFKIPFLWYGFPAFGIAYYFLMEEFVTFFRKLKAKTYG